MDRADFGQSVGEMLSWLEFNVRRLLALVGIRCGEREVGRREALAMIHALPRMIDSLDSTVALVGSALDR